MRAWNSFWKHSEDRFSHAESAEIAEAQSDKIIKSNMATFKNDPLSYKVIGCALEVYKTLGPGLLEKVYQKALMKELELKGLKAEMEVPVNIIYKGDEIGEGLRLDILVEDQLIIELKSVEELNAIHYKQLTSYLKLTGKKVGLLINFNVDDLMDGIHRIVNNY
jgi:GxxExxY protein